MVYGAQPDNDIPLAEDAPLRVFGRGPFEGEDGKALGGLFAGAAGLYFAAVNTSGDALAGNPFTLTSIAAVVLGGLGVPDEVIVEPTAQKITNPTAVFSGLDKITGRIITFDVAIGETVQFGALQVTPRACYTRPPTETPNTDGFVEVDEITLKGETKRIFTGWMFAASPGLHGVEHPIYDVWVTDCKGGQNPSVAEVPPDAAQRQPTRTLQPARPAQPLTRRRSRSL